MDKDEINLAVDKDEDDFAVDKGEINLAEIYTKLDRLQTVVEGLAASQLVMGQTLEIVRQMLVEYSQYPQGGLDE